MSADAGPAEIDRTRQLEDTVRASEPKPSFRDYPRLFRFVFSSAFVLSSLFLLFSVMGQVLSPLVALLWKGFVDSAALVAVTGRLATSAVLAFVGYVLVSRVRNLMQRMTDESGNNAFMLDLVQRNRFGEVILGRMHGKLSRFPPEYFESSDFYDRSRRGFEYVFGKMRREAVVSFYRVVAGILGAIAIFVALFVFHPLLALIAVLAPLPTLYSKLVGARITFRFKRDRSEQNRKLMHYEWLMRRGAAKELKAMNAGSFMLDKWEECASDYKRGEIRTRVITESIGLIGLLVNNIAIAGSAALGVWLLTRGELSLGSLGAVLVLSQSLVGSVGIVYDSMGNIISNRREVSQLFELLDLPEEPLPRDADAGQAPFGSLEARSVTYRYPFSDVEVLHEVDFSLHQGETVAFVGENGAGKTTFVKILLGMLTPTRGDLVVNGHSVLDQAPDSHRRLFSGVFQDYGQYRGLTVGENVSLGDNCDGVPEALDRAGFTAASADTMLGRDVEGAELSGGEWQKLAVARGLYRTAEVMVLDEPTASLDPLAEEAVFRRFLEVAEDKTAIVVTHRIGSASLADRIVVFKDGRIVEDGSHEELVAQKGHYHAMFRAQAEWYQR